MKSKFVISTKGWLSFITVLLFCTPLSYGQLIASWGTSWSGVAASPLTATSANANVSTAQLARVGLGSVSSSARYNSNAWSAANYLTITITAKPGFALNLSNASVTFAMGSSGTGPNGYNLYSNVDNYAASIRLMNTSCSSQSSNTFNLPTSALYNGLSTITFKIFGVLTGCSGTFASGGTGGPQNIVINGPIVASAIALSSANNPSVADGSIVQNMTKNALYNFQAAVTNADATLNSVTFTTTGTYAAGDISKFQLWYNSTSNNLGTATQIGSDITTPLGIGSHVFSTLNRTIKADSTGFFWITTDVTAGAAVNDNIKVSGLANTALSFAVGTVSGSASGGGVQTIIAPAQPSLSAGTFASFGNICTGTTSAPNMFTIFGSNLSNADVTVGPLTGFTFSTSAAGSYQSSLSLSQGGGIYSQDIYVELSPTLVQVYNGNIPVGGGGATTINVVASGSGVNTPFTVTTAAATNVTVTAATLQGTANNGCTAAITTYGIEYSTTNGFANGAGTQVAGVNLSNGNFSVDVSNLTQAKTYYYHAYANNGTTLYGAQQSFTTSPYLIYQFTTTADGTPNFVFSNLTGSPVNAVGFGVNTLCGAGNGITGISVPTTIAGYSPSNTTYANVDITPAAGYILTISGITVGLRQSTANTAAARLAYSIDGGISWIDKGVNDAPKNASCGDVNSISWNLTTTCGAGNGVTVGNPGLFKFRIYYFGNTANGATEQIVNLNINGTVSNTCNATATISGTTSICTGTATSITFTGTPNTKVIYTVNSGSNQTISLDCSGSATLNTGTLNTATVYSLVSASIGSCTQALSGNATVSMLPLPAINIAPVSPQVCPNGTINLTASGTSVSYQWSPNADLDVLSSASVNASPTAPGTVLATTTYTVTGTDVNGCSTTATTIVTTKLLPTFNVTPPNAVCTGLISQQLTASGAVSYSWAPATNINTSTGATVTAQISQLTFYTVTGTGTNGCTNNVIVPVATVATGGTISPVYSIICSGGTKVLTVTGAAGHDYQWQISVDNATWNNISGATNTTYTTGAADGNVNEYYRLLAQSNTCWNVASTTAKVEVSHPTFTVATSNITDNSVTLNWLPVGSGNYNISYTGTSTGTVLGTTPPKTLTGLTTGGNYTITINQTGTGLGSCPATGTAPLKTLCSTPTTVTVIGTGSTSITLGWTGGAGNYRVYYRPLYINNGYYSKDVTGATSTTLTTQGSSNSLYHSLTYEIYVAKLDCPLAGNIGQPSTKVYATTTPALACTAPIIDSVRSVCPVQIEVWMHGSPTNQYYIDVQRLTPTIQPVTSYPVTGNYFTLNTSAGQNYLITARSICGGAVSNMTLWPNALQVKPQCGTLTNLLLSNPTCGGFTASWNADQCLANNASYYELYIKQAGTLNWNGYSVTIPEFPIGPYKVVGWLGSGKTYDVYAKAVYNCNGYLTYGATTQTSRISTLSAGCREESAQPEEIKPAIQQTSTDNSEVLSLYPNPNNGKFTVDLTRLNTKEDAVRIEVINMIGQTVVTQLTIINDGHLTEFLNLPSGIAPGTYIVRVTEGKNVYTSKMNIGK